MKCEALFQEIDRLNGQYIKVWEDCCNLESPTRDKARVDAVGQYFAGLAKAKGWRAEIAPQEKAGDVVCITMNPEAEGAPVTISGHLDTVHPVGSFGTPAVRMDGEKIYGPGVEDCKGGSDAAFITEYGIPCVDSIGTVGGNIHSPGEFAWLRSLAESAKRIASIIYCI